MANDTKIQWTDHSINFWTGCIKVSAGCKFCYMYRGKERYNKDPTEVIQTKESTVLSQLKKVLPGEKVFTCSWSDFFIEEADEWRDWAWSIIRSRPDVIWQILTKRPERISNCLPEDWGTGWPNVWIGITVEDQKSANKRIPILNKIIAPTKFISFEPLIGPIDLMHSRLKGHTWVDKADTMLGEIHIIKRAKFQWNWSIIGGESGNDNGRYLYRASHLDWYFLLKGQLLRASVPMFFKQFGTHLSKEYRLKDRHGGDWDEWNGILGNFKVREFPK